LTSRITGAPEAEIALRRLRKWLATILLLGIAVTTIDLLLIAHYEDATQMIPLVILGLGFIALSSHLLRLSRSSLLLVQLLMVVFVVSGGLGMFLHHRASADFQREIDPDLGGSKLFWKAVRAKTPPALAPGTMVLLGLLGLAYAYRHSAVARRRDHIEEDWSE
jgi:hypothetical protein